MASRTSDRSRRIWPAVYVLSFFVLVGVALSALEGTIGSLVFFSLIGAFAGGGFAIHALASRPRRRLGRKFSLAFIGLSLFLGAGVLGRQSFQIEGFFFHALAGVLGGVVTHYLVAKILGPLLIGRAWCGWGCWIWMVLDYLPWKTSPRREKGWWPQLRTVHLVLSFGLVAVLALAIGYDHGFTWQTSHGHWWFVGGCAFYYGTGGVLAAALRDNRAFCKYACPVSVFLRAGSRLSLLKVSGARESCARCGACDRACPMDVRVSWYVDDGTRVLDPECTLCQACIAECPRGNLGLSLGLDASRGRIPPEPVSSSNRPASRRRTARSAPTPGP